MENISNFKLKVKSFNIMVSPFDQGISKKITRYVMFANIESLDDNLKNWFKTNPRHQNINQIVSKGIQKSLIENPENFHNLNKGILFSAKNVDFDPNLNEVSFSFDDINIHGNIDGGHTLKVINDYKKNVSLHEKSFVFVEIITGIQKIQEIVALAGARNKTVQVDLTSLANLEKKFDPIKNLLEKKNVLFRNRIIYKTNENKMDSEDLINNNHEKKDIKIRDFISVLNMFNLDLYSNDKNSAHPMISYSGKESALKVFLNLDDEKRTKTYTQISNSIRDSVFKMEPIIEDIFNLYDLIELEFPNAYDSNNKKYGKKTYASIRKGRTSKFGKRDLSKIPKVPDGLIYPLLSSFRALVYYNESKNQLEWYFNPLKVWRDEKKFLTNVIANFIDDNKEIDKPDPLGKSKNLWETLFDKILVYKLERLRNESKLNNNFINL